VVLFGVGNNEINSVVKLPPTSETSFKFLRTGFILAENVPLFMFIGSIQVPSNRLRFFSVWVKSGIIDGLPPTVLDGLPEVMKVVNAVRADKKIQEWIAGKKQA
jgi:hypothetical protein